MPGEDWLDESIPGLAKKLRACNRCDLRRRAGRGEYDLPSRKAVHDVLDSLIGIMFPGCHGHGPVEDGRMPTSVEAQLKETVLALREQIAMAFMYRCELSNCDESCKGCEQKSEAAIRYFVESLPHVQDVLQDDVEAAFDGDPAAQSVMEVVMSYPAVQAIGAYRIAHLLYEKEVPLIARIMTELAHSRTGIDIHPGATIGRRFFIDHGTGVVVGETTVIGDNVKIYQGVTLGAMSFPKGEDGHPVKGIKRHPIVGDNVTIYAEATLLGKIDIGANSEIGGNVWLTHSVPPNSTVSNVQPKPNIIS